jgi:hypothetical protein
MGWGLISGYPLLISLKIMNIVTGSLRGCLEITQLVVDIGGGRLLFPIAIEAKNDHVILRLGELRNN